MIVGFDIANEKGRSVHAGTRGRTKGNARADGGNTCGNASGRGERTEGNASGRRGTRADGWELGADGGERWSGRMGTTADVGERGAYGGERGRTDGTSERTEGNAGADVW